MRSIRELTDAQREDLRQHAVYEGSPHHKRNPGDFGLIPPQAPRPDKTLCDEAGVFERARAERLLSSAIERGLASEATTAQGLPKQLWAMDDRGQVFEAMAGGSRPGCYHGYPIRKSDPLFEEVASKWERN